MGFLEQVSKARDALQAHGRVSTRALGRELGVEGEDLEEIVEELVDIQRVAKRDGKALVWIDGGNAGATSAATQRSIAPEGAPTRRSYTPKHLAEKILASRSAMEGERKQVTVLFCDVADSMGLAEALGPESWHETLNELFEVLTSAVHEFEGTVNQYTGDGIMALFGAPIAAEDHARRACLAALAIQKNLDALRQRVNTERSKAFAARIGINSGEVVVGRIGDDLRMDYTAQGQVVGIAARLESLAQRDGTLVSEYSTKLAEGFFEFESIGPQEIKGVSRPLRVFKLGAAKVRRSRLDIARERGFSRFVGREAEMAILKQAFKRAHAGRGQVVGIVGPPGTGKSRLCWEFAEYCRAQDNTFVIPVAGQQHQRSVPYALNNQIMRFVYGFEDDDTPAQRREKIRKQHLAWDPKSERNLQLSYEFSGVADPDDPPPPMAPEVKRRWQQDGVAWAMRHLCKDQTVVFITEDLQWGDADSQEINKIWSRTAGHGRVLMVWDARPEFELGLSEPHMQQLSLQPLDDDALEEMLVASLGTDASLKGLGARLVQASSGNPFFFEEIIRSLIEQGALTGRPGAYRLVKPVDELPVPDTVQNVLAARIDRLGERDKHLLQTASVIGREFEKSMLLELSGVSDAELNQSLENLRAAEFVYSLGGERQTFKHALTQEVAYGSLLQGRRAELHRRIAEALARRGDDVELIEVSQQWEQAGDLLQAALTMNQAAKAMSKRDVKASLQLRREFLRLEAAQPANVALAPGGIVARSTLIEWSGLDPLTSAEARDYYEKARQLAQETNDQFRLGGLELSYSMRLQNEGRILDAVELVERTARKIESIHNPALQAGLDAVFRACIYAPSGYTEQARSVTANALHLIEKHPEIAVSRGSNLHTMALTMHGWATTLAGDATTGLAEMEKSAKDLDDVDIFDVFAHGWALGGAWMTGITDRAPQHLDGLKGIIKTNKGPWWQSTALSQYGTGLWATGNIEAAEQSFTEALRITEVNEGLQFLLYFQRPGLAQVKLSQGKVAEAEKLLKSSEPAVHECGAPFVVAAHCWAKCELLRARDGENANADETLALWRRAINEGGMKMFDHLLLWESARLALLKGDTAVYDDRLEKALASAEECGATGHAEKIRKELAAAN